MHSRVCAELHHHLLPVHQGVVAPNEVGEHHIKVGWELAELETKGLTAGMLQFFTYGLFDPGLVLAHAPLASIRTRVDK